jgi:hypothetical protein
MKSRYLLAIFAAIALTAAAGAQDGSSAPQAGQNAGSGQGGRYGQRGGRGGFGGGMLGRGMMGTVTEAAADHYTIKTEAGEVYFVHLSSNTRILKQVAGMRGPGGGGGMGQGADQGAGGGNGGGADQGGGRAYGGGQGMGRGGNPPQEIKATDIKVGDVVTVMGETDATAKSVAATAVALMDPQRVQQMREMEANFGKTWLMGKVTAIDGTKITLTGVMDNTPHTVVADENTTFRKRRDPVTLADIQVGDTVRADGTLKDGVFTATAVNVGGMMGGDTPSVPRSAPPQ